MSVRIALHPTWEGLFDTRPGALRTRHAADDTVPRGYDEEQLSCVEEVGKRSAEGRITAARRSGRRSHRTGADSLAPVLLSRGQRDVAALQGIVGHYQRNRHLLAEL